MDKFIKFAKSYLFWTIVFGFWGWFFTNVDSCSEKPKNHKSISHIEQNNTNTNDNDVYLEKTIKEADELRQIVNGDEIL